jgi:arylsulfatase
LFASDNGASAEIMVRGDGHDPDAPKGSSASFLCLGPGWSSAANTPMRRHKTWVHEGGISTPLIAHWPAGIRARGELRHRPGHLVDILPTLLELSGAEKPAELGGAPVPQAPGHTLVGTFAKDDPELLGYLWWQHEGHRAIRSGNWKLVSLKGGDWELYDLSRDRGESHNLAQSMPDRVEEMSALWEKQSNQNVVLAGGSTENSIPATNRR